MEAIAVAVVLLVTFLLVLRVAVRRRRARIDVERAAREYAELVYRAEMRHLDRAAPS